MRYSAILSQDMSMQQYKAILSHKVSLLYYTGVYPRFFAMATIFYFLIPSLTKQSFASCSLPRKCVVE